MIKCSKKLGVLSIVEKLNSNQKMRVAPLRDINYLVTDLDPKHPSLKIQQPDYRDLIFGIFLLKLIPNGSLNEPFVAFNKLIMPKAYYNLSPIKEQALSMFQQGFKL